MKPIQSATGLRGVETPGPGHSQPPFENTDSFVSLQSGAYNH